TFVNAGHNAPLLFGSEATTALEATGIPLGLLRDAEYEARTAAIRPGGALLFFTDGLTDSISGNDAENRLRSALEDGSSTTMSRLKSLIDPKFNEDDITMLLVKRATRPIPTTAGSPVRHFVREGPSVLPKPHLKLCRVCM